MSQYFAAALGRTDQTWVGREIALDDVEDLDEVADLLRDFAEAENADGPILLFVEENDEYVAIVRGRGDADPRVFLSDRRAADDSAIAAMLFEDTEPVDEDDSDGDEADDTDDEETQPPVAEPAGDIELLGDLGTSGDELLGICAEKGMLPADVISALCERAGCLEVLEAIREV